MGKDHFAGEEGNRDPVQLEDLGADALAWAVSHPSSGVLKSHHHTGHHTEDHCCNYSLGVGGHLLVSAEDPLALEGPGLDHLSSEGRRSLLARTSELGRGFSDGREDCLSSASLESQVEFVCNLLPLYLESTVRLSGVALFGRLAGAGIEHYVDRCLTWEYELLISTIVSPAISDLSHSNTKVAR